MMTIGGLGCGKGQFQYPRGVALDTEGFSFFFFFFFFSTFLVSVICIVHFEDLIEFYFLIFFTHQFYYLHFKMNFLS